jgi:ABC-type polysaccharide/polyol phosphate transport system ATPase subunit
MVLSTYIRKEIESAIKNWCPNVTLLKKGESRLQKIWKFKSGSDFIYGYLVGQMEGYIAGLIVGRHGKIPDSEEIRQVMTSYEKKDKTS